MELNELMNMIINVISSNLFAFIALISIGLGILRKTIKLSLSIALIAFIIHIVTTFL